MNTSTEMSKKVKSTEILIYLNKSSNSSNSNSLYTKSPPLVNVNEEVFNIASNVTIDEKNYNDKTNVSNSSGELYEIHDKIFNLDCRIIETEQYSRRESLVISGIPENISQKELEPNVLKILRSIGLVNMSSYEITACHRNKFPVKTIVRFTNRKVVEFCLKNRDFYENLCRANKEIVRECYKLKKDGWKTILSEMVLLK